MANGKVRRNVTTALYALGGALMLALISLLLLLFLVVYPAQNSTEKYVFTTSVGQECGGNTENMAYTLLGPDNRTLEGRPFNCSHWWLLDKYRLTDAHRWDGPDADSNSTVPRTGNDGSVVFVMAADTSHFAYLKTELANVRAVFGRRQKVIGYDLGGISANQTMMADLDRVCALEWRQFNFSDLPPDVRSLRIFAWKIAIIAEVLAEHASVVYVDTSIHFKRNAIDQYLVQMARHRIGQWQFPSHTAHSIEYATHPAMFAFIPSYWALSHPPKVFQMHQAGFDIVWRGEHSRTLLKWALLCALTRECIDPPGAKIVCPAPYLGTAKCHRQDQSVLSILANNLEAQLQLQDAHFISHYDSRHPRNAGAKTPFFDIRRRVPFKGSAEQFAKLVSC